MKGEAFILRNVSLSDGMYRLDGKYVTLPKKSNIVVAKRPESVTSNITVSAFLKDVQSDAELPNEDSKKKKNHSSDD